MSVTAVKDTSERVRVMVEGALCVALSVVFSYFKMFAMPQGGSVTLEMAPLLYFAYRQGFKWGAAAGAMSGVLMMLLSGYVAHPVQAVLDYPLAFGCLGLAGLFKTKPIIGTIVAGAARLASHVLSGAIFFASYAPEGQNPWIYSLVYNASYLIPALIISAVLALILWKRLGKRVSKV